MQPKCEKTAKNYYSQACRPSRAKWSVARESYGVTSHLVTRGDTPSTPGLSYRMGSFRHQCNALLQCLKHVISFQVCLTSSARNKLYGLNWISRFEFNIKFLSIVCDSVKVWGTMLQFSDRRHKIYGHFYCLLVFTWHRQVAIIKPLRKWGQFMNFWLLKMFSIFPGSLLLQFEISIADWFVWRNSIVLFFVFCQFLFPL